MTSDGLLLLSHCGYSFMEDLIAALDARGLRSFVLSSSPLPAQREARLAALSGMSARLFSTESDVLTEKDVQHALRTLEANGERVVGCLTVWEGYRGLMAQANAALGIPDLAAQQVDLLRDKLRLRNTLADAALSQTRAVRLTRETFETLQADGGRYFIKPVCGIASYGAFPLRRETEWSALERIAREAQADEVYRSAFGDGLEFMAEQYVAGSEFSFELIVIDGRAHLLAIHEKCEVTETAGTVLENACVSPPVSIDSNACAAGMRWIGRVFDELDLRWGCFHLEARYDGARWDLIEINPRVGGCLISPSVKALNGTASVLEIWIDLLLALGCANAERLDDFDNQIQRIAYGANGEPVGQRATFFRAYFARPGRIEFVGLHHVEPAPALSQIFLKAGDEVRQSSREVFLGQVLWSFPRDQCEEVFSRLIRASTKAIEVRYIGECLPEVILQTGVVEDLQ